MIELISIKKTYFQGTESIPVLKDISLHVRTGEIFGVIGKSGVGKSTLLRCINLLDRPDAGDIILNGHYLLRLDTTDARELLSSIGTVFQQFHLLSSLTAIENIELPLKLFHVPAKERTRIAQHLLELVDLAAHAHQYPAELSGGQKQRVAIARALVRQPKILLLDEITSSLDPKTTLSILRLLEKINKELNITMFLITHEMNVVKTICDHVALLDQGQIIEQADILTFFTQPTTSLAKELTQLCLSQPLPQVLRSALQPKPTNPQDLPLLKLFFYGTAAEKPLISFLIKNFNLEINILQASIEFIKSLPIGVMLVAIHGSDPDFHNAIKYLEDQDVHIEVIGYVPGDIHFIDTSDT